jgi:hypothetical protein
MALKGTSSNSPSGASGSPFELALGRVGFPVEHHPDQPFRPPAGRPEVLPQAPAQRCVLEFDLPVVQVAHQPVGDLEELCRLGLPVLQAQAVEVVVRGARTCVPYSHWSSRSQISSCWA